MDSNVLIASALVVLNIISFSLMAIDKSRASRGKWRISERTLFIADILFGGLGGLMGMFILRHKTRKWYFLVFFPLFFIVQTVIILFYFTSLGYTF